METLFCISIALGAGLIMSRFAKPLGLPSVTAYLVAGIFGLYIGDIAFGDKRRQAEAEADKKAEAKLLNAKRRGETLATEPEVDDDSFEDDDFDIDTYTSNRTGRYATESEIDDILSEFGSSSK